MFFFTVLFFCKVCFTLQMGHSVPDTCTLIFHPIAFLMFSEDDSWVVTSQTEEAPASQQVGMLVIALTGFIPVTLMAMDLGSLVRWCRRLQNR